MRKFLKNDYAYFAAALIIVAVFFLAEASFGIWPFGKITMASYDLLAQICPCLEHFFSVLDGTSGLFHTFYIGRGMDMFGTFAYFAISPFTFLFLILGRTGTVYMASIVLPLKAVCSSASAIWFTKKYFKNIPEYFVAVFGILYALGGYFYVANTYINWVDFMIYMPVVLHGFIKFTKGEGIKTLSISLALLIYCCFSIACFSFFMLFPIGTLYIIICERRNERLKKASELALSFFLAVAATLPLLLPSFIAYLGAGRNTGMFSNVFTVKADDATHLYRKFSYILCDGAFIFLTALYFIRRLRKDKEAKFLLSALLLTLVPCLIDESMLLLNFGSYYSYALRFGFVTGAILFYIAVKEADEIFSKSDENSKTRAREIVTAVSACLTVVAIFSLFLLFRYIIYGNFKKGQAFYSYFSSFAHSTGGLEGTAVLFGGVVVSASLFAVLYKCKLINKRTASAFVAIIALGCSVFDSFALVKGDKQKTSYDNIINYREMSETLYEKYGDDYARIKSFDYYISADSPITARYYSHGLFSSMADKKNLVLPNLFSYKGNGINSSRSNGGGVFSDSLMGYRFVVFEKKDDANEDYLEYTGLKFGQYYVYENTLAFPLASVVRGEEMNFDGKNEVERIESVYEYLSGGEKGLTEVKPKFTENDDGSLKVSYTVPKNSEYWHYNFLPSASGISYTNSTKSIFSYSFYKYVKNGGTRSVTLVKKEGALKKEEVEPYYFVASISLDKIKSLRDKLKEKEVKYELTKNGIKFPEKIIASKGDKLYLGYTALQGYTVYINGKKSAMEKNGAEFIIIPLSEGENSVEIKYASPYTKYIIIGAILSLTLIFAVYLAVKKYNFIYSALEKPVGILAFLVSGGVVAFFFAFPVGVYLYKIIMLPL